MLIRTVGFLVGLLLLAAPGAHAQQAVLEGTVSDDTNFVLPGVTVTATEISTGRQHFAVTDGEGNYRLPNLPPGTYRIQAELAGFATVVIPSVELLVGQNARLPFTLHVATLEETITVTGEAPLVDTRGSQVAGNVDRRQMEELPLQGRNWLELSMMVKGITANNITNTPGVGDQFFQLNLDGQQIRQQTAGSGFGQPNFSREAIAEFQIITNLFDVTQGRSAGIQVQAITRGGTNTLAGSFYGSFRHDRFNAADPVANEVLPFENQQIGGTIGGPIRRDRAHYFVSYEYEREPSSIFAQPAQLPNQSWTFTKTVPQNSLMTRVDLSASGRDHFSFRGSYWDWEDPWNMGSANHPSQAALRTRQSANFLGSWSRIFSDRKVGELRVGYNKFQWTNLLAIPALANTPNLVFPGLTLGQPRNYPQEFYQDQLSVRYDMNWHRDRHDFKFGGEFIGWKDTGQWQLLSRGEFIFTTRPPDLEARFPSDQWQNPAAWNLVGLDSRIQRFDQNFGDWTIDIPRPTWAMWIGDTWRITDRFTINYGARWDVDWGATAPPHVTTPVTWDPIGGSPFDHPNVRESIGIRPGDTLYRSDIRDLNNVAPRFGFNYNVGGSNTLSIRGGTGLFYTIPVSNVTFSQQSFNGQRILVNSFSNDGQPGFIFDPRRGVTDDDILSGRVPVPPQAPRVIAHDYIMPYTWQSTVGFQKQLSPVLGFDADLTFYRAYHLERGRDINLLYNPATGYNLDPAIHGYADPKFTQIHWMESTGKSEELKLATSVTRRLHNNLQGGVTYTHTFFEHEAGGAFGIGANNQFDLDAEWEGNMAQRHTLRANVLYRLPYGISLSGAYFYGSRAWQSPTISGRPYGKPGTNRLNVGAPIVVPDTGGKYVGPAIIGTGEQVPRASFKGDPLHKIDMRVSKDLRVGGITLTGIAEVFNLFNHANYGAYNTQVNSATFGRPNQSTGNAYTPRSGQFGFRVRW